MANKVFKALFDEKVNIFKTGFSSVSSQIFVDPATGELRHPGEYGMYRERVVRDFLKFIIPSHLEVSTGFVLSPQDKVSTQCDVVIFDPTTTPLYEGENRQRFFPVESVFCVGEVKSTLAKADFFTSLEKLSITKMLGGDLIGPYKVSGMCHTLPYAPTLIPSDLFPTILICQKLKFNPADLPAEVDKMYADKNIAVPYKHNLILSIDDGMLCHTNADGGPYMYPFCNGSSDRSRIIRENFFELFATFIFQLTSLKTKFHPELKDYFNN